jgi:F-type H+-transporting ATPase subunit b
MRIRRTATALAPGVMAALLGSVIALPAHAAGQLVLIPELPILLSLIALFVVFMFPLNALVFKPIFRALDERAARIAGARARADYISAEADRVLSRYQDSIRAARAEAESKRKSLVGEARVEHAQIAASARSAAERKVEQARESLKSTLEEARASLRDTTQELARTAAEQILGRPV